jgi:hypothetical protein
MSENNQTNSNGRGGARPGAGRKKGAATARTREIADKAASEGITPLEFMLQVMRTEPSLELEPKEAQAAVVLRFEAAKAAAPYMHPRLAAVEHSGPDGGEMRQITRIEIVSLE